MKRASVHLHDYKAGTLTEDENGQNFSLYSPNKGYHTLTPAYDMLSTALVMPEDTEELALTLNGKKSKIRKYQPDISIPNRFSLYFKRASIFATVFG